MRYKFFLKTVIDGKEKYLEITQEESKAEHQNTKAKAISHINKIRERHGHRLITNYDKGIETEETDEEYNARMEALED